MIDTKRLADDCFTLANEIHDIGYEHLIEQEVEDERKDNLRLCKQLNETRLNSVSTYARFQKLDLDTLARKLWDYSAQMKDEKYKIERDWNDPEHYLAMEVEYDLQKNIGERGKQDKGMVGNKNFMAEGMWKMLEPTLPSNDAQHVSFMLYQKSSYELLNGLRELQQRRIKSVLRHGGDKPHVVFNAQVALMEIGIKDPEKRTWVTQQDVASRKAVAIRKKKSRLEKKK